MPELDDLTSLQQRGKSRGEILAAMKERGFTIAEAIKTSMRLFGIGLGDAKLIVTSDPAWAPTAQAAAPFHDELIRLFEIRSTSRSGPRRGGGWGRQRPR